MGYNLEKTRNDDPPLRTDFALRTSDLLSTGDKEASTAEILLRSAAYSLIQAPIDAVKQVIGVDKATATIVAPAKEQEFGTPGWHAQQVGSTAGMLPWLIGIHKVVGRGAARTSLGLSTEMRHSFYTGAIYGGLLSPSRDDGNLLADRSRNALVGGLSFAAMAGTAGKMRDVGFTNRIGIGLTAGLAGGAVHAETGSILDHGRMASVPELAKDLYSFGLIGAGFGTAAEIAARRGTNGKGPGANVEAESTAGRTPLAQRAGALLESLADKLAPRPRFAFATVAAEANPLRLPVESQKPVLPSILNMSALRPVAEPIVGSDSGKNLGTRTRNTDGTVTEEYSSGWRVTTFTEGDSAGRLVERTIGDKTTTTYRNGDRVTEQGNKRVTERRDGGKVETEFGAVIKTVEECSNGTRIETSEFTEEGVIKRTTRIPVTEGPPGAERVGERVIVEKQVKERIEQEAAPDHWRTPDDAMITTRYPARWQRVVREPDGSHQSTSGEGTIIQPVAPRARRR